MNYVLAALFGLCAISSFVCYFNGVPPSESSNVTIGMLFLALTFQFLKDKK